MAPYVSLTQQKLLRLPLPDGFRQRAIAQVLSSLDDKIAANASLADLAIQLMKDHYRAALSIGQVRQGGFFDFFSVEYGSPFGGKFFSEPGEGRPLIRIRDLKTFVPQTWTTESRSDESMVVAGDVVVGMDAEFRPTPWLAAPGLLNQRLCRIESSNSRAFTIEAVRAPLAYIEGHKSGTTVIHLNKRDLAETSVTVPSVEGALWFDERASDLLDIRVSAARENGTLAATRDALLPHLMSGKLRVRDAERIAEDPVNAVEQLAEVGALQAQAQAPSDGLW